MPLFKMVKKRTELLQQHQSLLLEKHLIKSSESDNIYLKDDETQIYTRVKRAEALDFLNEKIKIIESEIENSSSNNSTNL